MSFSVHLQPLIDLFGPSSPNVIRMHDRFEPRSRRRMAPEVVDNDSRVCRRSLQHGHRQYTSPHSNTRLRGTSTLVATIVLVRCLG